MFRNFLFRRIGALAAAALSLVIASHPARATLSGLFVVCPNATANTASLYTTNSDGTLTNQATVTVGSFPFYATVSTGGAFAYTSNRDSNTISVIDLSSFSVVQTASTGNSPFGLVLSPDGTRLYVANHFANTISVFSVSTGQLTPTATISVGESPRGIAIAPDGARLYVVNQGGNTVSVVDTSTNTVTSTITVGIQPLSVAVSPSGTRAYVTNFTDNTVSVVDTSTNTVIATVATGSGPDGVTVSPNGAYYYTANRSSGTVSQFNTSDNSPIASAISSGTSTNGIAISPDGTALYSSNQISNNLAMFSVTSGTGALASNGTIASGTGPGGLGIEPLASNPSTYGATMTVSAQKKRATFTLTNTGNTTATFDLSKISQITNSAPNPKPNPHHHSPISITYLLNGVNVTGTFKSGKSASVSLPPNATAQVVVTAQATRGIWYSRTIHVQVTGQSEAQPSVKASAQATLRLPATL
ncbi:MAG TPA: beta-propeller fold lactonase family protein [Chthoniobacterales bacterium]